MASPFEELNAFNLGQLARSGQPLLRIGEAQIGLAQYQLEREAQAQDEERRRQGRVADALTIFEKEMEARTKREDQAFRRSIEREAAALGVETKDKSTASLLRETKLAEEADLARKDRKKVIQLLNQHGVAIPEDTTIPDDVLRATLGDVQEQRRLEFLSEEVKTRAQADDEARRERFEANRETIAKALQNIDTEADQAETKLTALTRQPVRADAARVKQRFFENDNAKVILAALKPEQLKLLRDGDFDSALQTIAKKDDRLARNLAEILATERALEETELREQLKQDILIARDQLKKRQFNKKEALYRAYGPDVFSLDAPRDTAPAAPPSPEGAFRLPPLGSVAPAAAPRPSVINRAFNAPGGFAPPIPTTGFMLPRIQTPAAVAPAPAFVPPMSPFSVQGFIPPFYTPPPDAGVFVGPPQ